MCAVLDFAVKGTKYHQDDFVLFSAPGKTEGPGTIGRIEEWQTDRAVGVSATVKLFGRVADIKGLPDNVPRDEVSHFLVHSPRPSRHIWYSGICISPTPQPMSQLLDSDVFSWFSPPKHSRIPDRG